MKTISRSLTMFGSALVLALFWGSSAFAGTLSSMTTQRNDRRLDLTRSKGRSTRPRLETLSKFVRAPITSRWRSPNG